MNIRNMLYLYRMNDVDVKGACKSWLLRFERLLCIGIASSAWEYIVTNDLHKIVYVN